MLGKLGILLVILFLVFSDSYIAKRLVQLPSLLLNYF